MILHGSTCNGIEQAEISQTLNGLCANLSRDPTSQRLMSPTFVPTAVKDPKILTKPNKRKY